MGMVFAQHLANNSGGFFVGRSGAIAHILHRVENAAVHWLEAVAHIRQGARDNDAHGVIKVSRAHLAVDIHIAHVAGVITFRSFGEFCFFAHRLFLALPEGKR